MAWRGIDNRPTCELFPRSRRVGPVSGNRQRHHRLAETFGPGLPEMGVSLNDHFTHTNDPKLSAACSAMIAFQT